MSGFHSSVASNQGRLLYTTFRYFIAKNVSTFVTRRMYAPEEVIVLELARMHGRKCHGVCVCVCFYNKKGSHFLGNEMRSPKNLSKKKLNVLSETKPKK